MFASSPYSDCTVKAIIAFKPPFLKMAVSKCLSALCFALLTTSVLSATKKYEWTFTWEIGAPDGAPRYMVMTNGRFPGPQLHLDEGDQVEASSYSI